MTSILLGEDSFIDSEIQVMEKLLSHRLNLM